MKNVQSLQTTVTLANATQLVCGISSKVLGNDVSDVINGSVLTDSAVRSLALSQFQNQQNVHTGSV